MPTKIKYSDIIMYLDAVLADANGDLSGSPHKDWWHVNHDPNQGPLAYKDFISGTVFGVGKPIIDQKQPKQSLFYILLSTPGGYGGYNQMPWQGPYITDAGYSVQLSNNVTITGAQIKANIEDWLGNGYPE